MASYFFSLGEEWYKISDKDPNASHTEFNAQTAFTFKERRGPICSIAQNNRSFTVYFFLDTSYILILKQC